MMDDAPAPWSEEAEISVLGAMLIDGAAVARAVETLDDGVFYREANRRIYRAMTRLYGRGEVIDMTTLSDELKSADELEAAGGMSYLARLSDAVPTAANVEYHCRILKDKATLRRLMEVAREVERDAAGATGGEVAETVARARERLRAVEARAAVSDGTELRTAAEILDDPDARRTPVTVADRLAWGGRVTMVAGREKSGKSTLLRWAVARRSRAQRVWGGTPLGGPVDVLYYGQEDPVDVAVDLDRMGADLGRAYILDMRRLASGRLEALRRHVADVEPGLVVVDTLSTLVALMDLDPGSASDWEPVMDRLGALAQESGAAVALNHHARKSDGTYRDSTAIGAGVDAILELREAPAEGEKVRAVTARPRSAIPANGFKYELRETDDGPRLELLDGELSLEERVQRFVADHPECSQRDVREGVRGKTADVTDTLRELSREGGPVVCDDSDTPYRYSIRQNPRGTGKEPGRNREGTAGGGNGGRSGSSEGHTPHKGGAPGNRSPSPRVEKQPRTCPTCTMRLAWTGEDAEPNRIGPTSDGCGACKRHATEVGELWLSA